MGETPRWVVVLVLAALLVGLWAFARGRDHRRGDEVGARGRLTASLSLEAGGGAYG
jgi:hypothetical protein